MNIAGSILDILWSIITENLDDLDRAAEALLAGQPE